MLEGRSIHGALDDLALAQIFTFPFRSGVWSIGGRSEAESPIGLWVAVEGGAAPDGHTIAFSRESHLCPRARPGKADRGTLMIAAIDAQKGAPRREDKNERC